MQFFRATVAYDGTDFAGWQIQPNQRTVQATFEQALLQVTGSRTRAVASGRTDAGVHAWEQVVSFKSDTHLSPRVLRRALDATTPQDLQLREVKVEKDGFHAIRDALSKRYRYTIQDGPCYDLFTRRYCWQIPRRLNVRAMKSAAGCLVGRHDFSSFEASGAPRKTSVRTILELWVGRQVGHHGDPVVIEIEADGFLYNMVRNIVGSLVLVGRGDRPPTWLSDVLSVQDRTQAGPTAPARGLMLWRVNYPSGQGGGAADEGAT